MTTFEKCKFIRDTILLRVGEVLSYDSWDKDYKLNRITSLPTDMIQWEEKYGSFKIDPNDLTESEMIDLGFRSWDEESNLRLIPLWIYPFLCESLEVESISGEKCLSKSKMHNDHRGGCLAYGVFPTKKLERERSIEKIES